MERLKGGEAVAAQRWPRLAFLAAVACALWLIAAGQQQVAGPAGYFLLASTRALVSLAALLAARCAAQSRGRISWQFLAVGFALWVGADLLTASAWALTGSPPNTPSFADLLRFSGFMAAIAGMAIYPATAPDRFGRLRELQDVLILGLSVGALAWLVLIRPVVELSLARPQVITWLAMSPVLEMILGLLLMRLTLLASLRSQAAAFGLMVLAAGLFTLSDLGSSYAALQGASIAPRGIMAGWMSGNLIFALALWRQADREAKSSPPGKLGWRARLEPMLPVMATFMVVGFTGFDWWSSRQLDSLGLAASILLSLLLVARQGVIAGQTEMRQFAALVNASADIAFVCSLEGKIRLANPSLLKAIGRQFEEVQRIAAADFILASSPSLPWSGSGAAREWMGEVRLRRADGSTFPAFLAVRPLQDERFNPPLLAATAHDLTQIKQRQEELERALAEVAEARAQLEKLNAELEGRVEARTRQLEEMVDDLNRLNQELQALDKLRNEFVALVSHELRAPLTNIQSGIELVMDGYPGLDESVHESLRLVKVESDRLSRLVETILDLSALESGHFPLQQVPVDLAAIARQAVLRLALPKASGRIQFDFPSDLPLARADEHALLSVLLHLLDNALKYSQASVLVDGRLGEGCLQILVTDHGPGIPAEERQRVFDMFHRLDSSDAREVYGYGLGLPMVRRLLEAMGGEVFIAEAPGGGTQVVCSLQVWQEDSGTAALQRAGREDSPG
jgi:PAS domain S-box-containing protein